MGDTSAGTKAASFSSGWGGRSYNGLDRMLGRWIGSSRVVYGGKAGIGDQSSLLNWVFRSFCTDILFLYSDS